MLLEETDPAHPMNATQLCERMQSRYEYSYNRKTIYTDIKRLQTYGMKIAQTKGSICRALLTVFENIGE